MYTMLYFSHDSNSLESAPYFYDEQNDKDYVTLLGVVDFSEFPIYCYVMDCDKGHWGP